MKSDDVTHQREAALKLASVLRAFIMPLYYARVYWIDSCHIYSVYTSLSHVYIGLTLAIYIQFKPV